MCERRVSGSDVGTNRCRPSLQGPHGRLFGGPILPTDTWQINMYQQRYKKRDIKLFSPSLWCLEARFIFESYTTLRVCRQVPLLRQEGPQACSLPISNSPQREPQPASLLTAVWSSHYLHPYSPLSAPFRPWPSRPAILTVTMSGNYFYILQQDRQYSIRSSSPFTFPFNEAAAFPSRATTSTSSKQYMWGLGVFCVLVFDFFLKKKKNHAKSIPQTSQFFIHSWFSCLNFRLVAPFSQCFWFFYFSERASENPRQRGQFV